MMHKHSTLNAAATRSVLLASFLGLTLFGTTFVHAQEPRSASQTGVAAQGGASQRGIEKSDIRRGQASTGDVDGDGFGDPAASARQADLKKLADELVNIQQGPSDTDGKGGEQSATKVDAGNALNGGSARARAGDPIPGIDITVNQSPGGSAVDAGDDTDATSESVPALDSNPIL